MRKLHTLAGDTLIEVALAVAIFSAVAVLTIITMNGGISQAQAALEVTLARAEIDAQAEALRFVHNSYVNYMGTNIGTSSVKYEEVWKDLMSRVTPASSLPALTTRSCDTLYSNSGTNIFSSNAFVVNARLLAEGRNNVITRANRSTFYPATLYPRIIYRSGTDEGALYEGESEPLYTNIQRVEGLYDVVTVASDNTFYDFYIYTCWNTPGADTPTTIGTVIRLYEPELREL